MRWPPPKPHLLGVTARPSVSPSSPAKSPPTPTPGPAKSCHSEGPGPQSWSPAGWSGVRGEGVHFSGSGSPCHRQAHRRSCGRWALAPGPVSGTQQSLHKHRHVPFLQQHTLTGSLLRAKHREGCWGPKTAVCVCVVVRTQVPRSDSLICRTEERGGGAGVCDSYRTLAVTANPQGTPGGVPSAMGHRSGGRVLVPGYRLPLRP